MIYKSWKTGGGKKQDFQDLGSILVSFLVNFGAVLAPKGVPGGGPWAQKVTSGTYFLIKFFKSVLGVDFGAILNSFWLLFGTKNQQKIEWIFDQIFEAFLLCLFALPGAA